MKEIDKLLHEVDLGELLSSNESYIWVLMKENLDSVAYYSNSLMCIIAELQYARKMGITRVPTSEVVSSLVDKSASFLEYYGVTEVQARNIIIGDIHKVLKPEGLVSLSLEKGNRPMLSLGPKYETTGVYAALSHEEFRRIHQAR